MKRLALLVLSACVAFILNAQKDKADLLEQAVLFVQSHRLQDSISPSYFDLPLRISPYLSANFGELREDHFHSGLDFKTQGVINKPVYAIAPGFVSRASVRVKGFGKAVYLDHPNGYTSVYGHLESFSPRLDSIVKAAQYAAESYEQNLLFSDEQIPVERGELIGYSGNTGSSGGPHLHFEIRQTESEDPVDPMFWYKDRIKDTSPPKMLALAIYAIDGQGILLNHGGRLSAKEIIQLGQGGTVAPDSKLPLVWGKIGLGIKAYNYMNGTNNLYGLSRIRLFLDGEEIFQQDIGRFSFEESRYLNALVDYEEWVQNRSWIMKSFVEPFNKLDIYPVKINNGHIDVNQEREYDFTYELYDISGNKAEYRFQLQGKQLPFPQEDTTALFFYPAYKNTYTSKDIYLEFPVASFYNKLAFEYDYTPPNNVKNPGLRNHRLYTGVHKIHHPTVPLHKAAFIRIKINDDILSEKNRYYLVRILSNNKIEYIEATYTEGFMEGEILNFGNYVVLGDSLPPKIFHPQLEKNQNNTLIRILVRDDESGLDTYRCTINAKWVLFEYDYKTNTLTADLRDERIGLLPVGNLLQIYVKDKCGNENYREWMFNAE